MIKTKPMYNYFNFISDDQCETIAKELQELGDKIQYDMEKMGYYRNKHQRLPEYLRLAFYIDDPFFEGGLSIGYIDKISKQPVFAAGVSKWHDSEQGRYIKMARIGGEENFDYYKKNIISVFQEGARLYHKWKMEDLEFVPKP